MSNQMTAETRTINGRSIQIRRFECHPNDLQIQLLSSMVGSLNRRGTNASYFNNDGNRTGSRIMSALHWFNGRPVHSHNNPVAGISGAGRGEMNVAAIEDVPSANSATIPSTAMSCMYLDNISPEWPRQPRFVNRVAHIDRLPIPRENVVWAIGGYSLLLSENNHTGDTSMRNRYLGLSGVAPLYHSGIGRFIDPTGLGQGRARTFLAYNPHRDRIIYGVMSHSIGTSIADQDNINTPGVRYFDMYTFLRDIGCTIGLNLDGGGSTRFRDAANTVQVGVRDVVCQLTHAGLN